MISFLQFAELCAPGKPLTEAQTEFCRVAFDGGEPRRDELGKQLWGPITEAPTAYQRRIIAAVWGRRSGKTWLSAMYLLYLACTVRVAHLARNEQAVCPIIAVTMNQARHTLNFIRGMLYEINPAIIVRDTTDIITIRREEGKEVTFQVLPASAGGRALRGKWFPGAFLDEACFFHSSDHKINDTEIFASIIPTLLPGGAVVIMSTPWSEAGLLYDLYRENYGHPKTALAAYAPTTLMRAGDEDIAAIIETERRRDPLNAQREYDAEFLPSTASRFFDNRAIEQSIVEGPISRDKFMPVAFGGDFAFSRDCSALVGVQRRAEVYEAFLVHERRPEKGKPLIPDEVCADFAAHIESAGGRGVMADGHYKDHIRANLQAVRLNLVSRPEGADSKAQTYVNLRVLMNQGLLRIPNHDRLLKQLRETTANAGSGGRLAISNPRSSQGGHGDLVDALVLAVWSAYRNSTGVLPDQLTGGPRTNLGPIGSGSTGGRTKW